MEAQKYLKLSIIGVVVIVVLVVGYGVYINEASRRHIDKMTEAQYTVLPVARADYRDIHAIVEGIDLTARTTWTIDVAAQYEGVLDKIYVSPSQRVEAGTVLATMTNNDLMAQLASAEANIEAARASFINAEQTANRYKYLVEHDAIAVSEYDAAVAQRDATRAQMESRIAQRDYVRSEQSKMTITAMQDANIIQIYHEQGKYVRAGEPLFMVADIRELNAFSIMEHEQIKTLLSVGNSFILEIKPHRLTPKAYPFDDRITPNNTLKLNQFEMTLARAVPDTGTNAMYHEIFWNVKNPFGIMEPTYYDSVKVMSSNTVHALVVPRKSVHNENGDTFVYTLSGDGRLARQIVVCGIMDENLVEIKSGLSQGDPVIAADPGGYTEGMKVGAEPYEF